MIPIAAINYNGSKDTIELIDSLMLSGEEFDLIITDNNSPKTGELKSISDHIEGKYGCRGEKTDYSEEKITSCVKYILDNARIITLIQSRVNEGFSSGTNIGLRYALYAYPAVKYIAILNNDTIVTKNFITNIINVMEDENIAAAMGTILFYGYDKPYIWSIGGPINFYKAQGVHVHKGEVFQNCSEKYVYREFVSGCFTIFKTSVLQEIGLLDEDYFFSGEEYQYSYEISRKHKLAWIPSSLIYHKSKLNEGNGSSHNIKDLAWQYNAYMTKIVFVNKNKGILYAKLWHMAFILHLTTSVKKRYLSIPEFGTKGYTVMKQYLLKNINKKNFSQSDFITFKNAVEK
jgi:hypothetical protein